VAPLLTAALEDGPAMYIVPRVGGGQSAPTGGVTLSPTAILEVDAYGNPVSAPNATQTIPREILKRFYVDNTTTSGGVSGFRVSTILDNGAFFFWECYLAGQTFPKMYGNSSRTVPANQVSQLMEVSYWPPVNESTKGFAIDFEFGFGGSPVIGYDNASIVDQVLSQNFSGQVAASSRFQLSSASNLTASVTLLNIAYGNANISHNITHLLTHSPSDGTLAHLRALLPFTFFPSMYYDPDMGVVFTGPVGPSQSSGSGFNNNYIAAIVVPTVLLALAIPAVIIIVVVILVIKKVAWVSWMRKTGPDEMFVTV